MKLVVATRSAHKAREIAEMLGAERGIEVLDLTAAGVPEAAEEADIEAFDTFHENALAKARYFAARIPHPVLADDSGICVDALDGAPGVYSKRFSGRTDLTGAQLDLANNQMLLEQLRDVGADEDRGAHYVCVMALVAGDREAIFRGTVEGRILHAPRGNGGFGYDPLFFLPSLDATFAEIGARQKNLISHRAAALRAALPAIHHLAREGSLPNEDFSPQVVDRKGKQV